LRLALIMVGKPLLSTSLSDWKEMVLKIDWCHVVPIMRQTGLLLSNPGDIGQGVMH
jgi:hypothetical protein